MTITQADREAAGEFLRSDGCPLNAKMTIHPRALIEAFARHRERAVREVLSPDLDDCEIEDALKSEGIFHWGPDGERFERMFAVVMGIRTRFLQPADGVNVPADNGE